MPSSDVIDMYEEYKITNALQEHALALHQMTLTQAVVDPSGPRCLEPLTSPGEMSGTHPSISSLRNSLRSACISAPIFIKNLEYANAAASPHCESVKEQHQSGNTELHVQIAFIDYYPQKMFELLDRKDPKGSTNVPQVGTSAVLGIKQEPQKLVMPAQAAVQNQQELSAAVQRSLEDSVYGGMAVDKSQLWGVSPHQIPLPTLAPGSSSKSPPTLGTPSQDIPHDRLSGEGVRPKDSTCLDFYILDGKGSRFSQLSPE